MLLLRTCNKDGTSSNGFQWPLEVGATTRCPEPTDKYGGGLHGLPWGEGSGQALDWGEYAVAVVFEAADDEVMPITADSGGKAKAVGEVTIRYVGDTVYDAARWLQSHGATGAVVGGTATAGDRGTATAGDMGTATAGDRGTATAGDMGTATAGDRGTATAGYLGTATAGYLGTATAGDRGTATAGYRGTATAGDMGTATAGDRGTATAAYLGTATAGDRGVVMLCRWDISAKRMRLVVGYIGEGGLRANIAYRLDAAHQFEAVGNDTWSRERAKKLNE